MRRNRSRGPGRLAFRLPPWAWPVLGVVVAATSILWARVGSGGGWTGLLAAFVAGAISFGIGLVGGMAWERSRWDTPTRALARNLSAFNEDPDQPWDLPGSPPLAELAGPLRELQGRFLTLRGCLDRATRDDSSAGFDSGEMGVVGPISARMTRSGTFDPPTLDPSTRASGEFSSLDMINRLDPRTLRWLDSSPSEQLFLGWSLDQLREKSFLEIVQADDRRLAKQQLRAVLEVGEGHGLIYRVTTRGGETRAIELNIGVRYGVDRRILHLRCHLADVTAKLRDESELRRRTQELTRANDELRRANRRLEKLKDRYSDLYENAPAMYFTLDRRGRIRECNNTLVRSLGHPRKELLGRPLAKLRPEGRRLPIDDLFDEGLQPGPVEFEEGWAKSDGEVIEVWVAGSALPDVDGVIRHVRCVAQDVTARRKLEAELREKNERLARANAELSGKNKELDEFTYVVSHDIQEPVRTLIAFSEFLLRDQADRLDDSGKEHARYLVDASRRLRALIQDLLALSRAGKVTAEFRPVRLDEVVDRVQADLAELIRCRRAEVRVESPLPTAWGDRDRIGQLVANLVSNGLKYNKSPAPRVEIRTIAGKQGGVTLSVRDNGIGIEPRFHDKIFRLFRRLHTREEYEGTGAGLAICHKIAEAHGGRIWLESEAGRGSTFHVLLPGPPPGQAVDGG